MNFIGIEKTVLHALGRNPLAEHPEVRLGITTDTDELAFPALVAAAEVSATAPYGNATADVTLTFTLSVPASDYTQEEVAAMVEETDATLVRRIAAPILSVHAEEIGVAAHFYDMRWNRSPAAEAQEGNLVFTFEFTGKVQF